MLNESFREKLESKEAQVQLRNAVEEAIKLSILSNDLEVHKYSIRIIKTFLESLSQTKQQHNLKWSVCRDWFIDFILRINAKSSAYIRMVEAVRSHPADISVKDALILIHFVPQEQKEKFSEILYAKIGSLFMEILIQGRKLEFLTCTRLFIYLK